MTRSMLSGENFNVSSTILREVSFKISRKDLRRLSSLTRSKTLPRNEFNKEGVKGSDLGRTLDGKYILNVVP